MALEFVEREIHTADTRPRYGMTKDALIGIDGYNAALTENAVAAAKRIGKDESDPGEPSCKMPYSAPYIRKTAAHLNRGALGGPQSRKG